MGSWWIAGGAKSAMTPDTAVAPSRVGAEAGSPWPLIGRQAELGSIRQAIAKGGHVLLRGRAGIGKSALLRSLAEQVSMAVLVPSGTPKLVLLTALEQTHRLVGLRVPEGLLPPTVKLRAQQRGYVTWSQLILTTIRSV